jgi:hypothetical protein
MSYEHYSVIDCDGHIVESVPEMAGFMSLRIKQHAIRPARNRQGVFPSLDGMHFALHEENAQTRTGSPPANIARGRAKIGLPFSTEPRSSGPCCLLRRAYRSDRDVLRLSVSERIT